MSSPLEERSVLARLLARLLPGATARTLASGVAWAFASKVASAASNFAFLIIVTRSLSVDTAATYFVLFSVVVPAAMIARLGVETAVVQQTAWCLGEGRETEAAGVLWRGIQTVSLASTLVSAAVTIAVAALLDWSLGLFAGLWVASLAIGMTASDGFRGFQDIRRASMFNGSLTALLSLAALVSMWLLLGRVDLRVVIGSMAVGNVANAAAALLVLWGQIKPAETRLTRRRLLADGLPYLLTSFGGFLLSPADIWILGVATVESQVAGYAAAARLVRLVMTPLILVNYVVSPMIARLYAQGEKERLHRTLRNAATVLTIPAVLLLFPLVLFSTRLMSSVYGQQYGSAGILLSIMTVAQVVNVWSGSCGITLQMTGHQRVMTVITLSAGAATCLLGVVAAWRYGALGLAYVYALSHITQNIIRLVAARRLTGIWTHARLWFR